MNKILMNNKEKRLILDKESYFLEGKQDIYLEIFDTTKEVSLTIEKDADIRISLFGRELNEKIHIILKENSKFSFKQFLIDSKLDVTILLEGKYSFIEYASSILSSKNSHNSVIIKHLAQNTVSSIKNHGFSISKADIIYDIDMYLSKESNSSISNQDTKIMQLENSNSQINPNLFVDQNDVEANHSAYIGEFASDVLFYLTSRGISLEESRFLLLKSFLVGSLELEQDIKSKYLYELSKYFNKGV